MTKPPETSDEPLPVKKERASEAANGAPGEATSRDWAERCAQPAWLTAAKSAALTAGLVVVLLLYRVLLFFVAFFATA